MNSMKMHFKLQKYDQDACVVYGFSMESTLQHNNMAKVVLLRSLWDRKVLKVMKLYFKDDSEEGESAERRFLTEAAILASNNHPFIMGIEDLGSFPDYHGFLMPYYKDGTLTSVLPTMNQEMKDEYFVQLCSGIKYLHERGVAHRDLKTDNILITDKRLVIADFGLADLLDDNESLVTQAKGTVMYISLEQYDHKTFDAYKCDMYALGVVYWCMVFKTNVLELDRKISLLQTVTEKLPVSSIDRTILTLLLDQNPAKRLSINQLIYLLSGSCFDHRIAKLRDDGFI